MRLDDIAGKRVLVTAAAGGIGATIAARFAAAGAEVHICDADVEALRGYLAGSPRIAGQVADVADPEQVDGLVAAATARLGGLDVLVSNAGVAGPAAPVEEMDVEGWRRTLDVNLTGTFLCCRAAVPHLKAAGGGSIAVMSSNAGTMACLSCPLRRHEVGAHRPRQDAGHGARPPRDPGQRRLSRRRGGRRIRRVIALEAQNRGLTPEAVHAERVEAVSLRTMVAADDVANLILFACSEAGARISGQALLVDGNAERA